MISIQDKKILKIYSQEKTPNEWVTFFDHKYTKSQISSYCHRNNYPMRKLAQQEKSRQQSKKAKKYNINQD